MEILNAALVLGLWRLQDGGWPRKIPGSNILAYLLCAIIGVIHFDETAVGLVVGILAGYQANAGYSDWNDPWSMLLCSAPFCAVGGLFLATCAIAGVHTFTPLSAVAPLLVIASNVAQPWLRAKLATAPHHLSNRVAEFQEGAALGGALMLL